MPSPVIHRLLTETDPWQALGLSRDADGVSVARAFKALSRQVHPDKNPDEKDRATSAFQKLQIFRDAVLETTVRPGTSTPKAAKAPFTTNRSRPQSSQPNPRAETKWQYQWGQASRHWGPGYFGARCAWQEAE